MILKSKTSTYLVKSHSLFTFIENEQRENNLSKFKLKICTKKNHQRARWIAKPKNAI